MNDKKRQEVTFPDIGVSQGLDKKKQRKKKSRISMKINQK